MSQNTKPAVVVGVDESLSGLAALRYAVAEARRRGVMLRAVRVNVPAPAFGGYDPRLAQEASLEDAIDLLRRAFDKAMFGTPDDLEVELVAVEGAVATELVGQAGCEEDLLVLGAPRRRRLGRPWFGEDRRCVRRAACPVVVVPAPALARVHGDRALARELLREANRLADAQGKG